MTNKENSQEDVAVQHEEISSEDRQRLLELLSRLFDEDLESKEQDELSRILLRSDDARSEYVQFANLHASLGYLERTSAGGLSAGSFASESDAASRQSMPLPEDISGAPHATVGTLAFRAKHWISSHRRLAASVLFVVSAGCLLLFLQRQVSVNEFDRERVQYAARIIDGAGCVWGDPVGTVSFDGLLRSSDLLRLEEGLAKLRFDSGAEVLLKGPADLFIESGMKCRLDKGELTANVPTIARGFTVQTPLGRLVDLGTAFGLRVGKDVDIQVFDGEVEVYPGKPGKQPALGSSASGVTPPVELLPVELSTGSSRRLHASENPSIVELSGTANPNLVFTRSLPEENDPTGKKPTVLAVDSFGQGTFGTRLLGRDGGFGWASAWNDDGVESNTVSFLIGERGVISRGTGDGAVQRLLAEEVAASRLLFFSAEFGINGPDQICSAWLTIFKYNANRWSNGEMDLVAIGITDGQFSGRVGPFKKQAEERKLGDCGRYDAGTRHLVVGKLEFNAVGGQERLSVWVNPSLADESNPDRVILRETGLEFADAVALRCWEMDGATVATIDEVRVGKTWISVVQ